jgi:hypothetical protein
MNEKIQQFLKLLGEKLTLKKPERLEQDLADPEKLAETISHSIGSSTQKITFSK